MYYIICLDSEWEHTSGDNKLSLHTAPLLEFIGKARKCKTIYRRIATRSELAFYLRKFKKYQSKAIFYLSFHGSMRAIHLEGEKNSVTFDELAEMANGCFLGNFIHFSSCRTLLGSEAAIQEFKESVGAISVSGYTKKVDAYLSAIHDLAYFNQLLTHPNRKDFAWLGMSKYYDGIGKKLGFRII